MFPDKLDRSGELDGVARQIIDATDFKGSFLHNLEHSDHSLIEIL